MNKMTTAAAQLINNVLNNPENFGLGHLVGLEQNRKYHHFDGWVHTVEVYNNGKQVKPNDSAFQLATLFHDGGKGTEGIRKYKDGVPSDAKHEKVSLIIAQEFLGGLPEWKKVEMLIGLHHSIGSSDIPSVKKLVKKLLPYSINKEELQLNFLELLDFVECDARGGFTNELSEPLFAKYAEIRSLISNGFFETNLFFIEDMPMSVEEMMAFGFDETKARKLLVSLMENGKTSIEDIQSKIKRELSVK